LHRPNLNSPALRDSPQAGTIALMSSAHLTEEQRTTLVAQLRRQLDYLNRLNSRIVKKRWPLEDPVCTHAILARRAVQSLYDAARLSGAAEGPGADDHARS